MNTADHISFWKDHAIPDFEIARFNALNNKNIPALFFYYLAIEKILKAIWVKDNPQKIRRHSTMIFKNCMVKPV